MLKGMSKNKILVLPLIVAMVIAVFSTAMKAEEDTIEDVEERIDIISEEERMILEDLFIQAQEIEDLEKRRDRIIEEIEAMKLDIESLEELIQRETLNYEEKLYILEQVLASYQRMGPSSFIDIILSSDSITNLLARINTLRDLTKNSGELLDSIDELRDKLLSEKENLDEKLLSLNERERDLVETILREEEKRVQLEEKLKSLDEDREYYQERLNAMMVMIDELEELMKNLTAEFVNIIEHGDLPEDAVEYIITRNGLGGRIQEGVFNQVVSNNTNIPEIIFRFFTDRIEMELPQENLLLSGSFDVIDGQILEFQVEEGRFYHMVLTRETIDEFFREGNIRLDLKPILGRNTIKKIILMDKYVQLMVDINL